MIEHDWSTPTVMKTITRDDNFKLCQHILRYLRSQIEVDVNHDMYIEVFLQKIDELYGVKSDQISVSYPHSHTWTRLHVPEDLLAIILLSGDND